MCSTFATRQTRERLVSPRPIRGIGTDIAPDTREGGPNDAQAKPARAARSGRSDRRRGRRAVERGERRRAREHGGAEDLRHRPGGLVPHCFIRLVDEREHDPLQLSVAPLRHAGSKLLQHRRRDHVDLPAEACRRRQHRASPRDREERGRVGAGNVGSDGGREGCRDTSRDRVPVRHRWGGCGAALASGEAPDRRPVRVAVAHHGLDERSDHEVPRVGLQRAFGLRRARLRHRYAVQPVLDLRGPRQAPTAGRP